MSFNINHIGRETYITPKWIYEPLGVFDLDPACPVRGNPKIAKKTITKIDWLGDGLTMRWFGRVWLNPPYGRETGKWIKKLAEHGNGIALTFSRTDTQWFQKYVFKEAYALLFLRGRVTFLNQHGNPYANTSGAPSVLIAYGYFNSKILENSGLPGKFIIL